MRKKNPKSIPIPTAKDIRRFNKLVKKKGGACWEWIGHKDHDGYGQFWMQGAARWASRVSYRISVGDPGDHHVDHTCTNPGCVNPAHLRKLTPSENSLERWSRADKQRLTAAKCCR